MHLNIKSQAAEYFKENRPGYFLKRFQKRNPTENTMTDNQIEQEIQAKGLTAPRITPADVEANIVHTEIVKHVSQSGQVLRWAVLTTRNGFAVTGRPSASVSSENDCAEIGEQVAIDNARSELWPLMGYELRSNLWREQMQREWAAEQKPVGGAA